MGRRRLYISTMAMALLPTSDRTAGIHKENPDTGAWLGFAFGDYDGDGKLDLIIVEPPFQGGPQQNDPTRNLLYKGTGKRYV